MTAIVRIFPFLCSEKNVRTFKVKRAHVYDRMDARLRPNVRTLESGLFKGGFPVA